MIEHWSDCAVHNAPAYQPGPCDCGAFKARRRWWTYLCHLLRIQVSFLKNALQFQIRRLFRLPESSSIRAPYRNLRCQPLNVIATDGLVSSRGDAMSVWFYYPGMTVIDECDNFAVTDCIVNLPVHIFSPFWSNAEHEGHLWSAA